MFVEVVRVVTVPLAVLTLLVSGPVGGASAQEGASVAGRVVDDVGGGPILDALVRLEGTSHRSLTDENGAFRFFDVPAGRYLLSVEHLAFGTRSDSLVVPRSGNVRLSVRLGISAFELEPLVVEVLTPEERNRRRSRGAAYRVTRQEIEEDLTGGRTLADILRQRVPGVTLSGASGLNSVPCVEFRAPPTPYTGGCNPPLVIVDGARIGLPNLFFDTTPPEHVESMTVLSAAVASVRYGPDAATGVIQVEMRHPGIGSSEAGTRQAGAAAVGWSTAYDWGLEESGHPWMSALGGATGGMLVGVALTMAVSGSCFPLNQRRGDECSGGGALLASVAGFTLPPVGGALGANLLGRTERSRGRLLATTVSAVVPMFMGYFFATPTDGPQFRSQMVFGRALIAAGIPVAATLADHLFRTARDSRSGVP